MSKKLSNPPVYYTIAQVQFSPVAAMANYINEIQEKLRFEGYTLFDAQKITSLHFDTPLPSAITRAEFIELPLWRITNSDRKSGFILSPSHLAYHTTHYETHDQFFNTFLLGLEKIHSIIKLDHLSRLGLRYLNAVLPETGEAVEQYLNDGLHGIRIHATPRYSLHESVYDTKIQSSLSSGTLVNRILCKQGPLGYPPDIAPHELSPMIKFTREDYPSHAVIDIDHFIEGQMPLDIGQTKTQLFSLHMGIKKVFESNITDYAKKVWSK